MTVTTSRWVVLSRPECSLCEEFLFELVALLGPERASQVSVQDISGDADLERRYGQRIPVLLVEDEFVCSLRLDAARVRAWL